MATTKCLALYCKLSRTSLHANCSIIWILKLNKLSGYSLKLAEMGRTLKYKDWIKQEQDKCRLKGNLQHDHRMSESPWFLSRKMRQWVTPGRSHVKPSHELLFMPRNVYSSRGHPFSKNIRTMCRNTLSLCKPHYVNSTRLTCVLYQHWWMYGDFLNHLSKPKQPCGSKVAVIEQNEIYGVVKFCDANEDQRWVL